MYTISLLEQRDVIVGRKSHIEARVAMVSYCFSKTIRTEANLLNLYSYCVLMLFLMHKLCQGALVMTMIGVLAGFPFLFEQCKFISL